ncbi:DUF4954 family protein [Labilibacter sediminis]|nr:DUF4954 family protein [Labilibacter sediminis]
MKYRNLTKQEITELKKQNCRSINGWENVFVSHYFISQNIISVTFSGKNYIGVLSDIIELPQGSKDMSGIYNTHIHNCHIGNQVYIKNIGSSISNYTIEENVIIQNVGSICVNTESSFGNGTVVCPVNEGEGRDVIIFNKLSAHTAYLMTFYRDNIQLIEKLKEVALHESSKIKSTQGFIKKGTKVINCGTINEVNIGEYATIEGTAYLENGSINSSKDSPAYIGHQVNAAHFIVSSGSLVSDGANLRHCFVGQGCEISKNYTAENSLFFANSQCLQGEACSIFAGPYTVTHHKSTLLIAGYYSFFNAGSGTNQSNHMYKLGPLHQGVMERGNKTGSDSYILWPAKIGAFTMVLGRHYNNPDTSDLPFSYLLEDGGKSVLMPAQNIFNVGTTRDVEKWPKRDKRQGSNHLDCIITDALTPYTINKIIKGIEVLKELQQKANPERKTLMYKSTQLSLTSINRGIKLYEQALVKYVGDELIKLLKQSNFDSMIKNFNSLTKENDAWLDLSGLICQKNKLDEFIEYIINNKVDNYNFNNFFQEQYVNYDFLKSQHCMQILETYFNIDIKNHSKTELINFIQEWINNNDKIKASIIMDAKKEFNQKSKIGFGIDGNETTGLKDFEAVRGSVETNEYIQKIEAEFKEKNKNAELIINTLN